MQKNKKKTMIVGAKKNFLLQFADIKFRIFSWSFSQETLNIFMEFFAGICKIADNYIIIRFFYVCILTSILETS